MNEKAIVIQQIDNLSKKFYTYDSSSIDKVINKNCKNNCIGKTIKFGVSDYYKTYKEIFNNKEYHILLNDGSLICYYYVFDISNEIIKHCIYYIPAPSETVANYYEYNYDGEEKIDNDVLLEIIEILKKYIRIDYSLEGKKEFVHTNVHLHFGLDNSQIRFPILSKIYPHEFLYFILKYGYESDAAGLEKLDLSNDKKIQLSEQEQKRVYISNVFNGQIL